jgi:hypothetical protein
MVLYNQVSARRVTTVCSTVVVLTSLVGWLVSWLVGWLIDQIVDNIIVVVVVIGRLGQSIDQSVGRSFGQIRENPGRRISIIMHGTCNFPLTFPINFRGESTPNKHHNDEEEKKECVRCQGLHKDDAA